MLMLAGEAPLGLLQLYLFVVLPCAGWGCAGVQSVVSSHILSQIHRDEQKGSEAWPFSKHRNNSLQLSLKSKIHQC